MENSNRLAIQIPEAAYSPSPPSEPPDLENWFASYAYESPILNTSDCFRDSVSGKSEEFVIKESVKVKEDERNLGESRKTRNEDDCELGFVIEEVLNSNVLANKPKKWSLRKVLDSSYTPSQVSEPPDIGNWFSSYVYESFVLDTNDEVKESVSQESECEKEGFVTGESQKEQEDMAALGKTRCHEMGIGQEIHSNRFAKNNVSSRDDEQHDKDNTSLSKISNSLDSHSDFTEPPDIKNWFSSYVYESPVLDTSDQIGDSLYLEKESEQNMFVVEDSDGEDEEKLVIIRKVKSRNEEADDQKVHSDGLQHSSTFEVNERDNEHISKDVHRIRERESPSSLNNLRFDKIFEENLKGRKVQSNGTSPSKYIEYSSFNNEGSMSKLVQEFCQETCSVALNVNRFSSSNTKKSPTRLLHRTDITKESLEANVRMEDVNLVSSCNSKFVPLVPASLRKQTRARNDKENEQEEIKENGFAATRKNGSTRTENENSLKRPQGVLLECPRNKGTVCHGENDDVKRNALMETTNVQHSDARAVTGKWRCPQKTKPNRGPPLKQLRLERWIHRL